MECCREGIGLLHGRLGTVLTVLMGVGVEQTTNPASSLGRRGVCARQLGNFCRRVRTRSMLGWVPAIASPMPWSKRNAQ
jgi:hypothetical protein